LQDSEDQFMKKRIGFFINRGFEYQISDVVKILFLDKNINVEIIHRDKWQEFNFKNCAIAVTTDSIGPEIALAMQRAKDAGVPSLTIQDGIIEYEHCWKKRSDRYRPLLTDLIAVFGNFTKQILISWGVPENKIHIVGCPRFDLYSTLRQIGPSKPRILLTCANTPYVDDNTKEQFRESFIEVAKELEVSGMSFFVRLNKRKTLDLFTKESIIINKQRPNQHAMAKFIGSASSAALASIMKRLRPNLFTIAQDIKHASAVITQISTVGLEAMAMGRPVAILNYSGETVYHRTPWEIRSRQHIKTVIQELLNPPPAKMLFQEQLFSEYVYCDGFASKRIADMINHMVEK